MQSNLPPGFSKMADKSILQPEPTEAAQAALAAASELQAELAQAKKRIEGFVNQNEQELSAAVSEHETVMLALEGEPAVCLLTRQQAVNGSSTCAEKIEQLKSQDSAAQSQASELNARMFLS